MNKKIGTMGGYGKGEVQLHQIYIPQDLLKLFNLDNYKTYKDKNALEVIHKIIVMSFEYMGTEFLSDNIKQYIKDIYLKIINDKEGIFNQQSVFAEALKNKNIEVVMNMLTTVVQDFLNTVEFVRLYRANITIDSFSKEFIICRTICYS